MVKLPSDEKLVIAAIGESGEGKSTLLNLILNSPGENKIFFEVSEAPEACTLCPRSKDGLWRGDPNRPITVIDTPGLGSEEGPEQDLKQAQDVVKILEAFGHVDAFIIVLKSGQSRFLSQHQHLFSTFQNVFGERLWKNAVIDVSHSCDGRNKKNFEAWMEKLVHKFPSAESVVSSKVFIDAPMMELDTLEELYTMCKEKDKFPCTEFESLKSKFENTKFYSNSSIEDLSLLSDYTSDENSRILGLQPTSHPTENHSRPSSRYSSDNSRPPSGSSQHLSTSRPISRSDLHLNLPQSTFNSDLNLNLPHMPPLPPRSPTLPSRRRTLSSSTHLPSRSLTSTPRLPRSFLPSFSPTDEYSSISSSTRLSRRSFRETSPYGYSSRTFSRETSPVSFSCRSSRETSPAGSTFQTVGIPTYLRTSFAHKYPFTKAMRSSRLKVSHAHEDRILLESCDGSILPLPECQYIEVVTRVPLDQDLFKVPKEGVTFERFREPTTFKTKELENFHARPVKQQNACYFIASQPTVSLYTEECENFETAEIEKFKARKSSVPKLELELFKPEALVTKTPYNLVKKALLPKIKYHWDQGFRQGPSGWQKVPVIKLKIKYNEEDQEVLPPSISVEGGRWCESKRTKLDGGKAKLKLRTSENADVQLRVVPLDKNGHQEAWVPEFLFTVEKEIEERKEGEKWKRASVTPAMPE